MNEYSKLQEITKNIVEQECKITALNNDVWKINMPDPESYRALAAKLNKENIQWHVYQDKKKDQSVSWLEDYTHHVIRMISLKISKASDSMH